MEHHDVNAYTGFAEVYDLFMDNVPYDDWCRYLEGLLRDSGIRDGLVLDLGCGTGNITERLAKAGYDMIGVDASEDMLSCALKKRDSSGSDILYLQQDMRSFELYGTVRAVVSLCDSMNYILDYGDLVKVFRLVNNYLDPGGRLIFDLRTEADYAAIGERTIAEDREESSFIWDNDYDPETRENAYELALFIRESGDRYRKFTETHVQKAWRPEEIRRALAEAGLREIAMYDAFTRDPVRKDSGRIYVIAEEQGKERKSDGKTE